MDKNERDKLKKYGKLVWDFANAKTSDDILISFFANVQSAFNFSDDFAEKALKHSPTMQMTIGALSSEEKKLFELLLKRDKIFKSCETTFGNNFLWLKKYEPIDSMFTISTRNENSDFRYFLIDDPKEETILIPEKKIQDYIDNSKIKNDSKDNLKANLKILVNIYNQIENIKSKTTNRFETIEVLVKDYPEITFFHESLMDIQRSLKIRISEIIKSGHVYELSAFKNIMMAYNAIAKTKYFINDDHKLIEIGPFSEDNFFARQSCLNMKEILSDLTLLYDTICYCAFEYIKNPEYSGKERIAICQDCKCFFSKSKLNALQNYCPICSKKNHTQPEVQRRRTQTSRDAAKKRKNKAKRKSLFDSQYKKLINSGYKEKKAKELAEDYVIEQLGVIE